MWVTEKGDSCDPFTKEDAGGTPAPQLFYGHQAQLPASVAEFAKFFGKSPDKLGLNELRTYQAYLLRVRKLTPGTVINQVAALRFFFVKTLKRHQFRDFLPYPQDQRRLPTVLSGEEVSRLINAAGTLFRRTLLMTLYGTGMRRSELAHLNHPSSRRQAWQGSRFALCLATADRSRRCSPLESSSGTNPR